MRVSRKISTHNLYFSKGQSYDKDNEVLRQKIETVNIASLKKIIQIHRIVKGKGI